MCGPAGGAPVCISNSEENQEVSDLVELGWDEYGAWIGINDGVSGEGTWEWNQNCGSTYENWAWGEPNDYCSGEDCGMIWEGGTWNDQSCRDSMPCVCEFRATTREEFETWDSHSEATHYECEDHWDEDEANSHLFIVILLVVIVVLLVVIVVVLSLCLCQTMNANNAARIAVHGQQQAIPQAQTMAVELVGSANIARKEPVAAGPYVCDSRRGHRHGRGPRAHLYLERRFRPSLGIAIRPGGVF